MGKLASVPADENVQTPPPVNLTQVVSELAAIAQRQAELNSVLEAAKAEARDAIIQGIRDYVTSNGFTMPEILPAFSADMPAPARKRGRGKAKKAEGTRSVAAGSYPIWALKSDQTKQYVRGVLPSWMKEAMAAAGLDPSMGADRAKFKEEHMVVLGQVEQAAAE